jgi:antitoxin MazE
MDKGTIRTRVSVEIVAGPILISTGIAWALEDRWHVTWFVLMPMLVVLLGGADAYRPERTSGSGECVKPRSRPLNSLNDLNEADVDGCHDFPYIHCRNGATEVISMHVRVQKWGNSLAVRIPKPLAEDAQVKEGTVLNLAVSEGMVVATPVEQKKWSLRQLLARVSKKNIHAEVNFGPSVGREIW